MAIDLRSSAPEVRERRLGAILSYHGTAADLNEKSKTKALPCKGRRFGQCSGCQEGCASSMLGFIPGGALIYHSPIGCVSGGDTIRSIAGTAVSKARGREDFQCVAICSNIQEKDTVYGGLEKLKTAIREAYKRGNANLIYVSTSCASGIIGDDIESVCMEMEDELGVTVAPVYCEGFKSRFWASGFDATQHAILKYVVKPPEKKQKDLVNVFNFEGADTFSPLLGKLGLRVQYLIPLANKEELEKMSEAACSVQICETLATYVSHGLEQEYGVPEVKAPAPYGINWTDEWLREVARLTDKTDVVEEVIRAEHERIAPQIAELKKQLEGKTLYVVAGDAYAHNLLNLTKDLGVKLIGATTLHHDQKADSDEIDSLGNLVNSINDLSNFNVCNKQPYEVLKILRNLKPDLLIVRHQGLGELGTKLGIPVIFEGDANYSIGYDGVVRMGKRLLEAVKTRKFYETVGRHTKLPYTNWWLNEETDPYYFEKGGK
jgi:nitrogenase molybdenum-iron protein alpha chain